MMEVGVGILIVFVSSDDDLPDWRRQPIIAVACVFHSIEYTAWVDQVILACFNSKTANYHLFFWLSMPSFLSMLLHTFCWLFFHVHCHVRKHVTSEQAASSSLSLHLHHH